MLNHAVSSPSEVIAKALELLREKEIEDTLEAKAAHDNSQSVAVVGEPGEQPQQTVLQRMGGIPQHLLSVGGLSDRETRRAIVTERIQARYQA